MSSATIATIGSIISEHFGDQIAEIQEDGDSVAVRYLKDSDTEQVRTLVQQMAEVGYSSQFDGFRNIRFEQAEDESDPETVEIRF